MSSTLGDFDPSSEGFRRNPYPYYSQLRKLGPVHYLPRTGSYWFLSHAGASRILTDKRFGKRVDPVSPQSEGDLEPMEVFGRTMLFVDPPDHTRLRGLVNMAFTPKMVESMEPRIREIAEGLLSGVESKAEFDVVAEFAFPLPAMVIAEILGVPREDRGRFKEWSDKIIQLLDFTLPEEEHRSAYRAQLELARYFSGLIERRRGSPSGDLISELIRVEEGGDRLSPTELLGMCMLLLVAGHETTTNLIANGFYTLLKNPRQLSLLRDNRGLMQSAVEELLRYEPPVQRTARVALDDLEVEGVKLKRGTVAVAVIGAANRDPQVFNDPDTLDITRQNNHHLSFGKGIHFCLGAPLARMEAGIAFNTLLSRLPNPKLVEEPEWKPNTLIRGLKRLIVSPA